MTRIFVLGAALLLAAAPISQAVAQAPTTTVSNGQVVDSSGRVIGTVGADGSVTGAGGLTIGWILGGVFVAGAIGLGVAELANSNNNNGNGCTIVAVTSTISACR